MEPRTSSSAENIRRARQEAMDAQVVIAIGDGEMKLISNMCALCSAHDIGQTRKEACDAKLGSALGREVMRQEDDRQPDGHGKATLEDELDVHLTPRRSAASNPSKINCVIIKAIKCCKSLTESKQH